MTLVAWALSGVAVLRVVVLFRRRWLAHEAARIDAAIRSNHYRYQPAHRLADDRLRARTKLTRDTADQMRAHAAAIESGASVTAKPKARAC